MWLHAGKSCIGGLALVGVIFSNVMSNRKVEASLEKAQAVTDTKLEELTREVREHNGFARRMGEIEDYLRTHTKADTIFYAEQHGIKLSAKDKKLGEEDKKKLAGLRKEAKKVKKSVPKVKVEQETPYQEPSYQEWDVQTALYDALDHGDKGDDNLS